jgi:hypothetical protein
MDTSRANECWIMKHSFNSPLLTAHILIASQPSTNTLRIHHPFHIDTT